VPGCSQPDFCAVLVLETCGWPSEDCKDFFDPHSSNPQCRALCCLFLDNVEWTDKQRLIVLSNGWAKRWAKLSYDTRLGMLDCVASPESASNAGSRPKMS
jgi:hypothetical protein